MSRRLVWIGRTYIHTAREKEQNENAAKSERAAVNLDAGAFEAGKQNNSSDV